MEQFFSFVEGASPDKIEEVYTSTFDLNPVCYPYVGYHLFGNDPQRAELMVKLQASYREVGLATGGELPDHVALMLRYLSRVHDPGVESEMTELLLEPALQKMAESLDGNNPYGNIVRSAWCVLRPSHSALRTTE